MTFEDSNIGDYMGHDSMREGTIRCVEGEAHVTPDHYALVVMFGLDGFIQYYEHSDMGHATAARLLRDLADRLDRLEVSGGKEG